MRVQELTRNQLCELKEQYFQVDSREGDISPDVAANIYDAQDIPDVLMYKVYDGIDFVQDDFFCTAGKSRFEALLEETISNSDELLPYSAVNIGYADRYGKEAETQLIVSRLDTKEGQMELIDLFETFLPELETTMDDVEYIDIVATADSEEELIKRGY